MKLSKIFSCLVPISLIGVTTPILTSCNKNALTLEFGDSFNCLWKDEEHTKVVKYTDYNSVASAVKLHCIPPIEGTPISISTLESQKEFQKIYWDFIAANLFNLDSKQIVYLHNELNDENNGFKTFEFAKTDKDDPGWCEIESATNDVNVNSFAYVNSGGSVGVELSFNLAGGGTTSYTMVSYTYQNCTAVE